MSIFSGPDISAVLAISRQRSAELKEAPSKLFYSKETSSYIMKCDSWLWIGTYPSKPKYSRQIFSSPQENHAFNQNYKTHAYCILLNMVSISKYKKTKEKWTEASAGFNCFKIFRRGFKVPGPGPRLSLIFAFDRKELIRLQNNFEINVHWSLKVVWYCFFPPENGFWVQASGLYVITIKKYNVNTIKCILCSESRESHDLMCFLRLYV